jgi:hypothetical protein
VGVCGRAPPRRSSPAKRGVRSTSAKRSRQKAETRVRSSCGCTCAEPQNRRSYHRFSEVRAVTPIEILDQLQTVRLHEANEAETRLKVINHVIFDLLGWTYSDVKVEERVSEDGKTTWADYILRTGMTAIVVEAKKIGAAFDEVPSDRRVRIDRRLLSGELGEAIIQARDYARKLSIPFAAVTNGDAWVIFPATRIDQIPFNESSAIIFRDSASTLTVDLEDFNSIISRTAVIGGSLENELLGRVENQIAERRLNRFFTSSFSQISRHNLFSLIEDAISTSFNDDIVSKDADLLEKCYFQTPERIRFDGRIKMHISRRESVLGKSPLRALSEDRTEIQSLVASAARRARPVALLVLGTVGSGKTTFLEHTRSVGARELLLKTPSQPYPHWISIDFKTFVKGEKPYIYIFRALLDYINAESFLSDYERCIKYAYKNEIEALFKGPLYLMSDNEAERKRQITAHLMKDYNELVPYVEKILRYASSNAAIFVVIDNIDQVEDERLQTEIFSEAMAASHKLNTSLICAMREATYVSHRNTPKFDAFDFDPITIDPPQVHAVLAKRFFIASQLLEGKGADFVAENGATIQISSLSKVIDLVQASVLGTEIGGLIDVLATSDIRLALRMTREFLQSGWTASGKAWRIYQSTGRYIMPRHEALRAIMLGNQSVYSEQYSVIGNPFDSRISRTEAQMLRLYVLSAVVTFASERSFRYIEGVEIQRCLREIGFGDVIIIKILNDLCRLRFIHTTSHTDPTFESNFIPSRLGGYVVRHFIADMMYLENVMMDTFIAEDNNWDILFQKTKEIYSERNILKRVHSRRVRCATFFNAMKDLYTPLRDESVRRGLPKEWCSHPFEAMENVFHSNLNYVSRSAERNYGRNDLNAQA